MYYVYSIVVLSIFLKNLYALFHFKGLKLTYETNVRSFPQSWGGLGFKYLDPLMVRLRNQSQ
jgi:hypothetical protein